MGDLVTKEMIEASKSSDWDFGNGLLYDLCDKNFYHNKAEQVLAKVWLIGRAYAAAIERRKIKEVINDDFYIDRVVPAFVNSELDKRLGDLIVIDELTIDNLEKILQTHYYFTQLTAELTGLKKRSFCSKYLHFHLPNLFMIYDSRVVGSLRKIISKLPGNCSQIVNLPNIDKEYAKFVCKGLIAKQNIEKHFGVELTLRQFDNLLIKIANEGLNNRWMSKVAQITR